MWSNSDDLGPLSPCCAAFRRKRLFALVRPNARATYYPMMLHDLIRQRTPSRMYELEQCIFGVFVNDDPFWGIYDRVQCPRCLRDLHVLAIDGQMITIIDNVVRRLYPLLNPDEPDDLIFRVTTAQEQEDARKCLAKMVFLQSTPLMGDTPEPGTKPHMWLTEAMALAYVFLVVHETAHQGPQRALGPEVFRPLLPTALAGAARIGINPCPSQAEAWARELHADLNAVLIMRTDALRLIAPEAAVPYGRALIAGVALALGTWELILREYCYGNSALTSMLVRTHPPANSRIEALHASMLIVDELQEFTGSIRWAERVLAALSDLYG